MINELNDTVMSEPVLARLKLAFPHLGESYLKECCRWFSPSVPLNSLGHALYIMSIMYGATNGTTVLLDDVGVGLYPHAARSLTSYIFQRADELSLNVVMTTMSPTVINCFRKHPGAIFTMQQDRSAPKCLTDKHDETWLAQFNLGDLYSNMDTGWWNVKAGDADKLNSAEQNSGL